MRFLIADTFTKSINRLDGRTRAAVKSVAFDVLSRSDDTVHRQHRLAHAKDRRFWSIRVNRDLRIIVSHINEDAVLCYAGHHDEAYTWAEQRKVGVIAVGSREIIELGDRAPGSATCAQRPGAPEHVPIERPIGSCLAQASREVDANERVDALDRESLTPCSDAKPRRLRMHNRAVAPLPVSSPNRAAGTSSAPPLVQLLRLAHAAAAPLAARDRKVASGATLSPPPEAPRPWVHALTLVTGATALASAVACFAMDRALRDAASLLAAGAAAATAMAALLAARQRASAAHAAVTAVTMLRDEIRAGHLGARAPPARVGHQLRPVLRAVDETVEAFADPFSRMTAALECLAGGELPPRLTMPFQGDFERHRTAIDVLAAFMLLSPDGIRRLIDVARAGHRGASAVSTGRDSAT
jgi:HAMP domain